MDGSVDYAKPRRRFWNGKYDRNAAINISKRGLGQASNLGVKVDMPRTFPSVDRNMMMRKEAIEFIQW